ncbi:unnamed protein product [Closterium sp. NIES-65]|nr:unnamed protein product [Closterium sp. NIES-65]
MSQVPVTPRSIWLPSLLRSLIPPLPALAPYNTLSIPSLAALAPLDPSPSPTPLLHHRYALPPSAAPSLASHPSPCAACAHTSPSARASGMLQRTLVLPPRRWERFVFGVVAPPAAPRSGGSLVFGAIARSAFPHSGGSLAFDVVARSASPRSGGSLAFDVVTSSASPRSGGSLVFGVVARSASPRSGGSLAFGAVASSASPRSGGSLAFGAAAPSASPRSGGFFAYVTVVRSASLRSRGFASVTVARSASPRSGGFFAFSLFSIAAGPRDGGFFNFFLPIIIARRVHLHVVVATPSIHSAPASRQIPRIAGRGPPPGLRSDVQIRSASSSAHAHWRHQICAIRRPPWRARRRPPSLP